MVVSEFDNESSAIASRYKLSRYEIAILHAHTNVKIYTRGRSTNPTEKSVAHTPYDRRHITTARLGDASISVQTTLYIR